MDPTLALAELFSSKVRAAVLGHLLPRPRQAFGLTELSRPLGLRVSSLQHECYKLERIGVLRAVRSGGVRRYRPNASFALLDALSALVLRAVGPEAALRAALEGAELVWVGPCFLAGDPSDSRRPTTLVVVGDLTMDRLEEIESRVREAVVLLGGVEPELGYFRPADWAGRLASADPLAAQLLAAPMIDLLPPPQGP